MLLRPLVLISALVSAGLFSSNSYALSMDALETRSYIGQPLVARFLIRGVDGITPDTSCLKVSDADNGVPGPGRLQISAEAVPDGWLIRLRGKTVLNEPAIQFLMSFDCHDQRYAREYSVLLDLPEQGSITPIALPADNTADKAVSLTKTTPTAVVQKHARAKKVHHAGKASPSAKKRRVKPRTTPLADSQPAIHEQRTTPPAEAHDVVKLSSSAPKSPLSQREAELMAQAEDQTSRLAQMEQRIVELQKIVDKMQAYVPEASSALALASAASTNTAMTPVQASAATDSIVVQTIASTPAAKPVIASPSTATNSFSIENEDQSGIDRDTILWTVAGGLSVLLLSLYLLNRREMQRQSLPWLDTEMLEDYDPELRAELRARMNAEDVALPFGDRFDRFPVPPIAEPQEPKVDYVDVHNAENVGEEAQFLINHGEGEQAITLLREALRINPDQPDLWMMAFEYLYAEQKKLEFVAWSQRFRKQAVGTETWARVCDLGLELDPENRLFLSDGI